MEGSDIDFADIQRLVRYGHGHLKEACFLLLTINDPVAARAWLLDKVTVTNADKDKLPDRVTVTSAKKDKLPDCALQVAFTHEGLKKLGIPDNILNQFSDEFISGMAEKSRSRRLGDVGDNDPKHWRWGSANKVPHVLLLLYAKKGELGDWQKKLESQLSSSGFSLLPGLTTDDIGDIEPFGFRDGVSQPTLDWDRRKPMRLRDTFEYTNLAALGEFLLGYPNEYGKYTDRPLLDPSDDPEGLLPLAEDTPGKRDFGRNGTYLVLRDLSQDVRGFWQFLDRQAKHDPRERKRLAEIMTGRTMSGYPIVLLSPSPIDGIEDDVDEIWRNQFTYENDPDGIACPYGAHIRRANPRNADLPEGSRGLIGRLIRILGFGSRGPRGDLIASTRFHRILRRGREYGSELKPEDAVKRNAIDAPRGLRFICLNANILRQFEFVQSAWLAGTKFDGLSDESDPLVGNRLPLLADARTDTFSIPQETGLCRRISGLPQFVTVQGGAYFFLPSIRALKYIASCASK